MKLLRGFWTAPLAAGALMWASFPGPDLGWLMPVAWAVLLLSMRLRRGERAGMQMFVGSMVLFLAGLRWLIPLAWPLWIVVALWCSMWEGFFGRFAGKYLARDGGPPAAWIVVLPLLHLAADMGRTLVLTGFPWFLTGYSGWRNPVLLGSADLLGVHGATLAILMAAAGLAECVARVVLREGRAVRAFVPAAIVWAGLAAWAFGKPAIDERAGPTLLLLQPAIPQELKEKREANGTQAPTAALFWSRQEELTRRGLDEAAARGRRVDLVVWAETMVPTSVVRPIESGRLLLTGAWGRDGHFHRNDDWRRLVAASSGAETLAGVPSTAVGTDRFFDFNTVVLLDDKGLVKGFQDKQHLTPGGEYIPLRSLVPFRERFEEYLRSAVGFLPDLQPGESGHVLPLRGGGRVGVLICYESVYPEVPRDMVRGGATLLVNCSNYGWFAHTDEMGQALAMCAFRSAELRRSVVLSSNNGICAVVGPDGRVRGEPTTADEPASAVVSAPLCESSSPFVAIGEWGGWTLGAAGVLLCLAGRRRGTASSPETKAAQ